MRLFGLADWLVDRYTAAWGHVMDGLWESRRTDFRLTVVLAILQASVYATVLWWSATATAGGSLSMGELAVFIQSVLGMAGLGSLDGDVWIDNGANAELFDLQACAYGPTTVSKQ